MQASGTGESGVFRPHTDATLRQLGITPLSSIMQADARELAAAGFSHIITDGDGVLNTYRQPPHPDIIEHIGGLATELEHGVSIVSNNVYLELGPLPKKVRLLGPVRLLDYKPSPLRVRRALQLAGATAKETIGIGDGLTDMLAFRAARLGKLCLVKSCGPHPKQRFVHDNIYPSVSRLVAGVIHTT